MFIFLACFPLQDRLILLFILYFISLICIYLHWNIFEFCTILFKSMRTHLMYKLHAFFVTDANGWRCPEKGEKKMLLNLIFLSERSLTKEQLRSIYYSCLSPNSLFLIKISCCLLLVRFMKVSMKKR